MWGGEERNGLVEQPHLSILELPAGWRASEHSFGPVYLALNEALKVTEEGRTLPYGSPSQLCLGQVSQKGRTNGAVSFLTKLKGPYVRPIGKADMKRS